MKSISPRVFGPGLCAAALLGAGCASDAPALPPPDGPASADGFGGQTGSPGAAECTEPEVCRVHLEAQAQTLAGTSNSVRVTHYQCIGNACRGVLEVDGRCVPSTAVGSSRSHDCALGGEAILEAEERYLASERQAMQPATPQSGAWQRPDHYENGSLGYVELGVNSESWGSYVQPPTFFAGAQFFRLEGMDDDVVLGEILDPLQGIDDCGVLRQRTSGMGVGTSEDYFQIGSASISVDGQSIPVEPTSAHHAGFSSYSADFSGLAPRFGETYQFTAQGGELPGSLSVSLLLPEELRVESLERVSHVPRGALSLRWTGKGSAPLHLLLGVGDAAGGYQLECRLRDDGAFTIPEQLLALLPDGVAGIVLTRETRVVPKVAAPNVLGLAHVRVAYNFSFGATCDGAAAARACDELAGKLDSVYAECGLKTRTELGSFCPDYLSQACGVCARMFSCQTEQARCLHPAIFLGQACGCDVQEPASAGATPASASIKENEPSSIIRSTLGQGSGARSVTRIWSKDNSAARSIIEASM